MAHRIVGESYELGGSDEIRSIVGHFSSALIGDTLSIDTIEATIQPERAFHQGFIPSGSTGLVTADNLTFLSVDTSLDALRSAFADGEYLLWYSGSNLKGRFYVDGLTRVGTNIWEVNASSAIGLLRRRIHNGGIYIRQTVSDVLSDIIGDTFTYSVSSSISTQMVAGWLPRASARDNLHQLMLALGINITKDSSGNISFVFVEAGTPTSISNDRVFLGGKVISGVPASRVEVVSHQFIALTTDESVVLFDNTTGGSIIADHQLVTFQDAPVHDLTATDGLTVHESNSNYAIVSGIGVLTGQKYTHTMSLYAKNNSSATVENVRSVTEDTLINDINGQNVLDRLYDYYTSADSVNTDIVVESELPNDLVQLEDAFGDTRQLWLKSMDVKASTILRASCELISGYTPSHNGNLYTHRTLITSSGTWTVPTGITLIRLILIAGGSGGQGGMDGADGYGGEEGWGGYLHYVDDGDNLGYVYQNGSQEIPTGGQAGQAGEAGKVYAVDIAVTAGASIALTVGARGTGGASGGSLGTAGGATSAVVGGETISSESGQNTYAFVDLFTGDAYSIQGEAGHAGGNGGQTDIASLYAYTGNAGYAGADVDTQSGGTGGSGCDKEIVGNDWLISDYYAQHEDLTQNGITGTWSDDNAEITLSGTATAQYENQILPNSSSLPIRPGITGTTLYIRSSGLSNNIKLKLTFLLSDSSTQDVYITSDSVDLTPPTNAEYLSYVGLVVTSGTVLTTSATVSVTMGISTRRYRASGGGGGGSAYGANGSAGTDGTWNASTGYLTGGSGGNGANASAPSTPSYGSGGGGGNGGGAGGNGAGCRIDDPASGQSVTAGDGGTGGTGSRGGHGGAGCVLIYY